MEVIRRTLRKCRRVSWELNGIMDVKHFINCKVPHKREALSFLIDEHTHAHTPTSTGTHPLKHTLLLQKRDQHCAARPCESHAGTSPCPASFLGHYPLRLSGFRKVGEGLEELEEKQVSLDTACSTHTCPFFYCTLSFVRLSLTERHVGTIETPPSGNAGSAGLTLGKSSDSAAFFLGGWVGGLPFIHSPFQSTRFIKHLLYPYRSALSAGNPKTSKSSLRTRGSQGQLQRRTGLRGYSEHFRGSGRPL